MTKKEQDQKDAALGRNIRAFLQGSNHAMTDTFSAIFPTPVVGDFGRTTRFSIRMARRSEPMTMTVSAKEEG